MEVVPTVDSRCLVTVSSTCLALFRCTDGEASIIFVPMLYALDRVAISTAGNTGPISLDFVLRLLYTELGDGNENGPEHLASKLRGD